MSIKNKLFFFFLSVRHFKRDSLSDLFQELKNHGTKKERKTDNTGWVIKPATTLVSWRKSESQCRKHVTELSNL